MSDENPPPTPPPQLPPPIPVISTEKARERKRSSWPWIAAGGGLLLVALLVVIGMFGYNRISKKIEERRQDNAVFEQLKKDNAEMGKRIIESESMDDALAIQRQAQKRLTEAASKISTQTRTDMENFLTLLKPFSSYAEVYTAQVSKFFGADYQWLKRAAVSREGLENARTQLQQLSESNTKLVAVYDDAMKEINRRVTKNDSGAGISIAFLKDAQKGMKKQEPHIREARKCDTEIYAKMNELTTLMIDEWGKWTCEDDGTIIWQTDELLEKHQAIDAEMQKISQRQIEAQKAWAGNLVK